jgi:DNA polymerase III sliding clamp (beta) subunit (PCNA family)
MNTITLPTSELKSALHGLGKIIGKRSTLPVLQHVRISKNDGKVTLQASDLDAFATYTMTLVQPGKSMEALVPYEQLSKASKCSKKEDVTMLSDGKNTRLRYYIAGNPIEQPVNGASVQEWPPAPNITAETTVMEPGFGGALRQAMECCSTDPSRVTLNGACLDANDAKAHYVVATNGRMLYAANTFHFNIKDHVIVPNSRFITGSDLLDAECSFAVQSGKKPDDAKHICLKNDRWEYIVREVQGKFPNWKQVLPVVNAGWTKVQLLPTAVDQLLKVIPNLPGRDGDTNTIRLCLERMLRVEAKNKEDADWTKVSICEVDLIGKPKTICVNRDYLVPALKFGLTELAVLDDLSPMVAMKSGKVMVIMPVRPTALTTNAAPSPASPTPTTPEERKDMPRTPKIQTPTSENQPAQGSALKTVIDQVEKMRESLKTMVQGFGDVTNALKLAEKEKKAQEKEIETVRASVRRIQSVSI